MPNLARYTYYTWQYTRHGGLGLVQHFHIAQVWRSEQATETLNQWLREKGQEGKDRVGGVERKGRRERVNGAFYTRDILYNM